VTGVINVNLPNSIWKLAMIGDIGDGQFYLIII
jgi:hypothetical protein